MTKSVHHQETLRSAITQIVLKKLSSNTLVRRVEELLGKERNPFSYSHGPHDVYGYNIIELFVTENPLGLRAIEAIRKRYSDSLPSIVCHDLEFPQHIPGVFTPDCGNSWECKNETIFIDYDSDWLVVAIQEENRSVSLYLCKFKVKEIPAPPIWDNQEGGCPFHIKKYGKKVGSREL